MASGVNDPSVLQAAFSRSEWPPIQGTLSSALPESGAKVHVVCLNREDDALLMSTLDDRGANRRMMSYQEESCEFWNHRAIRLGTRYVSLKQIHTTQSQLRAGEWLIGDPGYLLHAAACSLIQEISELTEAEIEHLEPVLRSVTCLRIVSDGTGSGIELSIARSPPCIVCAGPTAELRRLHSGMDSDGWAPLKRLRFVDTGLIEDGVTREVAISTIKLSNGRIPAGARPETVCFLVADVCQQEIMLDAIEAFGECSRPVIDRPGSLALCMGNIDPTMVRNVCPIDKFLPEDFSSAIHFSQRGKPCRLHGSRTLGERHYRNESPQGACECSRHFAEAFAELCIMLWNENIQFMKHSGEDGTRIACGSCFRELGIVSYRAQTDVHKRFRTVPCGACGGVLVPTTAKFMYM